MAADWDGWAIVSALLLVLVVLLVAVIWSIRRHRAPRLSAGPGDPIDALVPSLAGLSLGTLLPGNAVDLFENGAFFDALFDAIAAARHSVHLETFLWKEGVLGRRLAEALAERASAGCEVRLTLDSIGCKRIGDESLQRMVNAGCRIAWFHPRRIRHLGVVNDRTHRKLVVIDGREAFVGGHCIVDAWLGNAGDRDHFADISARLRGPIVHSVQAAFSENWLGTTGEVFLGERFFPELAPAGAVAIHAVYAKPEGSAPAVKILHHTAIGLARRRIWIQNPYFIPEPAAIEALGRAVERGVDVRVLMPAASSSDMPLVQHAGHRNFARLLRCGVRLFEYPATLLHQKVMTIDGTWSALGSCNFDDRSFESNDEITLGILDAGIAARLDAIFERYAADATELDLDRWQRRPLLHRLRDHAAYTISEWL